MGCSPSRAALHSGTALPWNHYGLHRPVSNYNTPNLHWNTAGAVDTADALLPPPYSVAVLDGHVSVSHNCSREETTTEWQETLETDDLNTRLDSLQLGDTVARQGNRIEPSSIAQQDRWQRRIEARSAPDISALVSRSFTPPRRASVSPFREECRRQTLDDVWPNRQLSRRSLDETRSTSGGRLPDCPSVSRIRSPETVRAERLRRKRMRRRSTRQLDFGRCPIVRRHSSGGQTLQPSITERNRSVPDFSPFVMAISPTFQFGAKVRQRSTSAPLPQPVTAPEDPPDAAPRTRCTRCDTPVPDAVDKSTRKMVCSEMANAHTLRRLSPSRVPAREPESPFKLPTFGRIKLPPIRNVSNMSTDVAKKTTATTMSKVGREPDDLLPAENIQA